MRAAAPAPAEVANGGGADVAEEQPAKRVCPQPQNYGLRAASGLSPTYRVQFSTREPVAETVKLWLRQSVGCRTVQFTHRC